MELLPKHLEKIMHVTERDETCLSGEIVCECGCKTFGVKYFGEELNEDGEEYPFVSIGEYKGKSALTVKAVCPECGKEHELYDFAKHAYDGLICGDGISVPDTELKSFTENGEEFFEINITVEADSEEQFAEELINDPPEGMSFTPDDRFNIWSWIVIDLICPKGGGKIKFVDDELA